MQQLFSTTGAELSTIRAQVPPMLGAPHSRGVCPPHRGDFLRAMMSTEVFCSQLGSATLNQMQFSLMHPSRQELRRRGAGAQMLPTAFSSCMPRNQCTHVAQCHCCEQTQPEASSQVGALLFSIVQKIEDEYFCSRRTTMYCFHRITFGYCLCKKLPKSNKAIASLNYLKCFVSALSECIPTDENPKSK